MELWQISLLVGVTAVVGVVLLGGLVYLIVKNREQTFEQRLQAKAQNAKLEKAIELSETLERRFGHDSGDNVFFKIKELSNSLATLHNIVEKMVGDTEKASTLQAAFNAKFQESLLILVKNGDALKATQETSAALSALGAQTTEALTNLRQQTNESLLHLQRQAQQFIFDVRAGAEGGQNQLVTRGGTLMTGAEAQLHDARVAGDSIRSEIGAGAQVDQSAVGKHLKQQKE